MINFFITILILFISSFTYSQQTIEICEWEPQVTKTYSVFSDVPSNLTWTINGNFYSNGNNIDITWDSVGIYNVIVSGNSIDGDCPSNEVTLTINVIQCNNLIYYVPNSFTPDGDTYNQYFKPIFTSGFDLQDFHMKIYNRWGNLIWESYDPNIGWDGYYGGLKCQDGIYIWKIDFGILGNDERILDFGHITLIK